MQVIREGVSCEDRNILTGYFCYWKTAYFFFMWLEGRDSVTRKSFFVSHTTLQRFVRDLEKKPLLRIHGLWE
jgi:pimeloyl-CoA synthetase